MGKRRNFHNKVVVITGGAGGLGVAFGHRFGQAGARLALLDLERAKPQTTADHFKSLGIEAIGLSCDVSDPGQVVQALEQVLDQFGGVDVLINNAGVSARAGFERTCLSVFHKVMGVNFFGALNGTKAALPSLRRRMGLIITISSLAGFSPLLGRTAYAASKHALHGLFDSLRSELRGSGVGVLMVCPGFTATRFGKTSLGGDGSITRHPQSTAGKPASPDQVADLVFKAACTGKRLLVLTPVGRLGRFINKWSPSLYEWLMARALRSELQR